MFERLFARIMPADLMVGPIAVRHLPFILFAYACLLPRELTVEVMDAALIPYRLAVIVLAPFAITIIAREPLRPSLLDPIMIMAALWAPIALYFTTSLQTALVSGGSYALDVGLAYLIGRAAIRTPQDLRTIFLCLFPGLIALVGILAVESLSRQMILRPTLANIMGLPQPNISQNIRFGLLRATGPFPHPILGGVFLAGLLPLAWYLTHNIWQRIVALGFVAGAIFTVSSAAILGIALAAGLVVLDIVQRISRLPIFLLAGLYGAAMTVIGMLMAEGSLITFVIRNFTFDPVTGYYRIMIWQFGWAEVENSPLYGIGQRDWARPIGMVSDSVDAWWLVLAMSYGLPAMILAFLAMIGGIIAILLTQRYRHSADRDCAKAMIFFLMVLMFCGLTVHFWESLNAWAFAMLGVGVSLSTQARAAPRPVIMAGRIGRFDWVTRPFRRPGLA